MVIRSALFLNKPYNKLENMFLYFGHMDFCCKFYESFSFAETMVISYISIKSWSEDFTNTKMFKDMKFVMCVCEWCMSPLFWQLARGVMIDKFNRSFSYIFMCSSQNCSETGCYVLIVNIKYVYLFKNIFFCMSI